jgi:ammonium transporter, Amt family
MDSPTLDGLARQTLEAHTAITMAWMLTAGFLVVLIQAGFALVDAGLVRAKNAAHTVTMGFLAYVVSILGFWAIGFGLQMGGSGVGLLSRELTITLGGHSFGLMGLGGFFVSPGVLTSAVASIFVLRAVFMSIATTIPAGATAERWKLSAFVLFSLAIAAVIYPIYANWVWGGGWLSALGRNLGLGHGQVDFAGSSVVHMTGGVIALVAAKVLGPRLGKYTPRGEVRPIPAHNMPMVVLGTFILAFGWLGLTVGSSSTGPDVRMALVAMNTLLASAAGGLSAYVHTRVRFGKPDVSMMCNGLLAGIVGISAACAFVSPGASVLIGAIASVIAVEGALLIERKLRIDDPVGAGAVHGLGGAWGLVAVGVFANGRSGDGWNGVAGPVRGLLAGSGGQLAASLIGIGANLLWVIPASAFALWCVGRIVGNRVSADDEIAGLDVPELGMTGYVNEAIYASAARGGESGRAWKSGSSASATKA